MTNCKAAPTPAVDTGPEATMTEEDVPTTSEGLKEIEGLPFLELIGCLWWLAQMTRLDIFVALQRASHWVARPSPKLWRWLTRILKYLAGTKHLGLVYERKPDAPPLMAYVDAAFADNTNCRSTAGWVFRIHGAVVAYDSIAIKRVVTSSTEAECCGLTIVGKENSWQRQMYQDLTGEIIGPTPIKGDNTASISLISAGVTKRSRHFSIEWFKFRDLVENQELTVSWVSTDENLADFFTKKLPRERFVYLRDALMGSANLQDYFGKQEQKVEVVVKMCRQENEDIWDAIGNDPGKSSFSDQENYDVSDNEDYFSFSFAEHSRNLCETVNLRGLFPAADMPREFIPQLNVAHAQAIARAVSNMYKEPPVHPFVFRSTADEETDTDTEVEAKMSSRVPTPVGPSGSGVGPSGRGVGPSGSGVGPSPNLGGPSPTLGRPSADLVGPSSALGGPSAALGGPRRTSSDLHRPSADLQRPSADLQRPSADLHWPSSDLQRPSSDLQRPSSDLQRPSSDLHWPLADLQRPLADLLRALGKLPLCPGMQCGFKQSHQGHSLIALE